MWEPITKKKLSEPFTQTRLLDSSHFQKYCTHVLTGNGLICEWEVEQPKQEKKKNINQWVQRGMFSKLSALCIAKWASTGGAPPNELDGLAIGGAHCADCDGGIECKCRTSSHFKAGKCFFFSVGRLSRRCHKQGKRQL